MTVTKSNERLERKQLNDELATINSAISTLQTDVAALSAVTVEVFDSSGTFTVPSGVDTVWLSGCAAGGGGAYDSTAGDGGAGGGGGEVANRKPIYLGSSPPSTVTVTIGAAGTGKSTAGNGAGTDAADTTFGSFLTLEGGEGGQLNGIGGKGGGGMGGAQSAADAAGNDGTSAGCIIGGGSGGGSAQSGSNGFIGGHSVGKSPDHDGAYDGGHGGGSLGDGGDAGTPVTPGYGGGGGGGEDDSTTAGQNGGAGILFVEYYS